MHRSRPRLLKRLLEQLACQDTLDLFNYSMPSVDHDGGESAGAAVLTATESYPVQIGSCPEPEQGIVRRGAAPWHSPAGTSWNRG
jgi:hypothetical protein